MKGAGFILVIEHYLERKGMASVLSRIPGVRIIREFGRAEEFVQSVSQIPFDFLIICDRLLDRVADSFQKDPGLLDRTLLLKTREGKQTGVGSAESEERIDTVLYYSDSQEEFVRKIRHLLNSRSGLNKPDGNRDLTEREKTIVRLVSLGNTNKQIAAELFLSTHTVITHRKNVTAKLGIKSVSALTVYAIVNNIITMEEVASDPRG